MPKAYVIGRAEVSDPERWGTYSAKATNVIVQYGPVPQKGRGGNRSDHGRGPSSVVSRSGRNVAPPLRPNPSPRKALTRNA